MNLLMMAEQKRLQYKRVASTQGGEYKSSCPNCGGDNRFFMQPNKPQKNCSGYYRCRKCGISGDTIQFAMNFLGMSFKEAQAYLGLSINYETSKKTRPLFKKQIVASKIVSPSRIWKDRAIHFVERAHQSILSQPQALDWLNSRGISIETIKNKKIGWNNQEMFLNKSEWGIMADDDKNTKLWLPQGIIIPTFDKDASVQRIKIRRFKNDSRGKYIIVSGSSSSLSIIGDRSLNTMIIVESELDAYALYQEINDLALVVAVGSNVKKPDNIVNFYAQDRAIIVCPDNDNGGNVMQELWKKWYPNSTIYPTSFGKDIGEAIEQGLKIRPWILQHKWQGHKDRELVHTVLQYISGRKELFYRNLENEIFLGPDSPRAETGELQKRLRIMRELFEQ
jgi:DNA primase